MVQKRKEAKSLQIHPTTLEIGNLAAKATAIVAAAAVVMAKATEPVPAAVLAIELVTAAVAACQPVALEQPLSGSVDGNN